MLKTLCEKENSVDEYFSAKAINNSLLKMVYNPYWIKWKIEHPEADKEDKRHFRIGAALDCLLTDPDRWTKDFFIFNLNKPSGNMGIFIDNLPLFALNEENEPIHNEKMEVIAFKRDLSLYQEAYKKAKYKLPIGTIVQNFWSNDNFIGYYRAREQANGKTIISEDEYLEIENALEAIRQNPYAPTYFTSYTQVPIYWTDKATGLYEEQSLCKALLDFVYVDEVNKVFTPGDLKTTAFSPEEFIDAFYKNGYFTQAAWYMHGLEKSGVLKYYIDQGYTISPFTFIVASKKKNGMPALIYEVSEEVINIGKYGGTIELFGKEKTVKGCLQLFDDLTWHTQTNNYSAPRHVITADFKFTITNKT